jgi:hydroxymethylpyrimidine pyrophosphatase-like HAD family hydrolase
MIDSRPKTIICDIDGTLVEHQPLQNNAKETTELKLLPGTIEKLSEWEAKGYNIILMTGRKESMRVSTETQLRKAGIFYDILIMGVGGGARYLINDKKPNGTDTSFSINLDRNDGIQTIEI